MKLEPVAWMNDSTPSGIFARHPDGARNFNCNVPLYAIPEGYVVVHKAQLAEAREVIASLYAKTGYCDENLYKSMDLIDRAMTAQGEQ